MQLTPNRFDYWQSPTMQRTWALIRFELLYLAWAVMDMALITPIALALFTWMSPFSTAQVATAVLLLIMFPFYLARLLTWARFSRGQQRQILMLTALFVVALAVRNIGYETTSLFDMRWIGQFFRNLALSNDNSWQRDLGLFALITVAWWRGIMLVSYHIDTSRFGLRFKRGSLYLLPAIVLLATVRQEWSILSFVTLYFVTSLIAMVLTRVEQAERNQGAILSSMSPRWLTAVSASSILVTLLAGATALFVSGDGGIKAATTLGPVWMGLRLSLSTIGLTIAYLAAPFIAIFEAIFNFIINIFQKGFANLFEAAPPAEDASDFQAPANEWIIETLTRPQTLAAINWRLVLFVVLVLFIVIVTLLVGRYFQADKTGQGNGRFGKLLADVSHKLTPPRFRQKRQKEKDWRNWETAASIIKIYQDMLHAAAQLAYPRDKTETPYEYLATLKIVWPQYFPESRLITHAYVNIKYGQFPESQAELQEIKDSWNRIKKSKESPLEREKS